MKNGLLSGPVAEFQEADQDISTSFARPCSSQMWRWSLRDRMQVERRKKVRRSGLSVSNVSFYRATALTVLE